MFLMKVVLIDSDGKIIFRKIKWNLASKNDFEFWKFPIFDSSDTKSFKKYQKILWICSLGYESRLNFSWHYEILQLSLCAHQDCSHKLPYPYSLQRIFIHKTRFALNSQLLSKTVQIINKIEDPCWQCQTLNLDRNWPSYSILQPSWGVGQQHLLQWKGLRLIQPFL